MIKSIYILLIGFTIFSCSDEGNGKEEINNLEVDSTILDSMIKKEVLQPLDTSVNSDTAKKSDSLFSLFQIIDKTTKGAFSENSYDYGEYIVNFTLTTQLNKTIYGFYCEDGLEFKLDSIDNLHYLLRNVTDSLLYFNDLISYNETYSTIGGEKIGVNQIKNIVVNKLINTSYIDAISNNLNIEDSTWLKTPTIKIYGFGGFFCSWGIFVHEKSSKTTAIINEANKALINFEKEINDFKENLINEQEDEFNDDDEIEYRVDSETEKLDGILYKIIKKLGNEKVVIIKSCSC